MMTRNTVLHISYSNKINNFNFLFPLSRIHTLLICEEFRNFLMAQRQYISPSFREKLILPFGWTLHMPMQGWTYYFCFFCRPSSAVRTLGFCSFQGKVFILSLPNLVWVFIALIACMGLLLVKIAP